MKQESKAVVKGSREVRTVRRLGGLLAICALALCGLGSGASSASAATATMGTVTKVFSTTAEVSGTIGSVTGDPGGTTYWRFDISTDSGANWTAAEMTTADGNPVPAGQEIHATLIHLIPETEYLVRFVVYDELSGEETISGANSSFTATAAITEAPTVLATDDASEVAYTTAKATGEVQRPAGEDPALDATCNFEYITDTAYVANPVGERFSGATPVACNLNPVKAGEGPEVEAALTGLNPATTYHLRLVASNPAGTDSLESADVFTTLAVTAPTVAIDPVTTFDATSAHLTGAVNPNGTDPAFAANWHFECVPACGEPGGTVPAGPEGTVEADVSGVEPNTTYQVKLIASNLAGPGEAGPVSFETLILPPLAQTGFASEVEATATTLNGKVNPHNSAVTYQFEYGSDESYGSKTAAVSLGQIDNVNHQVTRAIEDLQENTTYHFRLLATNTETEETTRGEDHTFRTLPADACPNEQLRAENNSLVLPDCRAYEQVSPVKKNGFDAGAPNGAPGYAHATVDGDGILFKTRGPMGDTVTRGVQTYGLARRGAEGWRTVSAVPNPNTERITVNASPFSPLPSADLSKLLFVSSSTYVFPDNPQAGQALSSAIYLAGADGSVNWITRPQIPNPEPAPGEIPVRSFWPLGGSPDLSTFYFWAAPTLLPGDSIRVTNSGLDPVGVPYAWGVYEYSEGQLRSAATLPPSAGYPEGTEPPGGAAPASGAHVGRFIANLSTSEEYANPVSRDGSTFFFVSPDPFAGDVPEHGGALNQTQLYVRRAGHSTLVSHAQDGSPAPSGVSAVRAQSTVNDPSYQFAYASPDGSTAIFQSTSALTASAPTGGSIKTYSYDVKTDAVTYLAGVEGGSTVVASSEDGGRFLFGGPHQGIGLWKEGEIKTIASGLPTLLAPARTTASGSVFVFSTNVPIPGFNTGGVQVYRYDVAAEQLSCLSCPPDDVNPSGDATLANQNIPEINEGMIPPRAISADAERVFFDSPDQLVPGDDNSVRDVYEWTPGGLSLITSGQGKDASFVLDNSADGRDIFFATTEGLDPRDTDSSYDVYDARVGGGFAQVPAVADCDANEVCKKVSLPPPAETGPASEAFSGAGNPAPCPKGKARKRGSCVKPKAKSHKKKHHKHHRKSKRTSSHGHGDSK